MRVINTYEKLVIKTIAKIHIDIDIEIVTVLKMLDIIQQNLVTCPKTIKFAKNTSNNLFQKS